MGIQQLARWQKESLSKTQRQQAEQMAVTIAQLKLGLKEVLVRSLDLKDKTIESVMSKSNEEIVADSLSGTMKPPA